MQMPRVISLAVVTIITCSAAYAVRPVPKPQEVVAPYWTSEPGWVTELQLKNNLASGSLTVTPVLRVASGQEIPLDPVTIASNDSVSVWVNEGLLNHAPNLLSQPGSYGSVVFRFVSGNAENLRATASLAIQGEPIGFPVNAYPAGENSLRSNRPGSLEGIWWQPRSGLNDVLVISNSSEKKISGTLSLFDAGGKRWSQTLAFGPHQTRRMATDQLVRKAGLSGSYGGIKFEVPAFAPALDGLHFMYDETGKASILLDLFNRDPNVTLRERTGDESKQWTVRAPMLALQTPDPTLGLPARVVLQPTLFVRNTTAHEVSASISLMWRGDSGKGQVELPKLTLPPFATQELQIGAMQKQLGIPDDAHWALVTLTSSGMPDDLIAVASSYSRNLRYNLQSRFLGGLGGYFVDGKWQADSTHNHIVAVTNGGTRPTDALLTLHYDNGEKKYELQQTIQPGDQMWLNMADLIRKRVADRHGNLLPAELTTGTFDLRDLTPGGHSLTESSLAIDNTLGFQAAPPPCPSCCSDISPFLSPDPVSVIIDGLENLSVYGYNSCTSGQRDLTLLFSTWGSDNTSIASVTTAQAQGVAPGETTGFAEGFLPGPGPCSCSYVPAEPTVPITVLPIIGGPTTLWWFKGLSQGVSGYNNQITLTASPLNGSYQWKIAAGSDKVSLSNSSTNNVTVTSIGQSTKLNDVSITATVNGETSAPFTLTVRAPYALASVVAHPAPVYLANSTFVWENDIYYTVVDNLLAPMPVVLPINESFTTMVLSDYPNENWIQGGQACVNLNSDATFFDQIGGQNPKITPTPVPTPVYNTHQNGPAVQHWGQDWRVGTCQIGYGPRVQKDTLQKYTDHAAHTAITTPAP